MGILARLFNAVPRKELRGVCLGKDAYWEVSSERDLPSLLRALPKIVTEEAILYLEGGNPPKEIREFLDAHCVPEITHLAMGTIWPRPLVFHIPATSENLNRLASYAERCNAIEVAVHLHIYRPGKVMLEWYDAFFKDPMYLSRDIEEENVRAFCKELSLKYKICENYVAPGTVGNGTETGR